MTKIDLGQTITILANLGVIIGIVLLAVELRQNNELLAAEARRTRAMHMEENYGMLATDSELSSIQYSITSGEELTDFEEFRATMFWLRTLTNLEWAYTEMPPEELETAKSRYRVYFSNNYVLRNAWAQNQFRFSPSFVEWLEKNVVSTIE
jgi:UDP-N-acetylglucosamine pyrophosphorylase